MTTKQRIADANFKAVSSSDGDGTIEAIVSVFNNIDSYGDVVMPGAFEEDLEAWKAQGVWFPWVWSHQWGDLDSHIGEVIDAAETDEGLWVKAQHDMDDKHSAKAFKLLKGGRIRQFSFAFDIIDGGPGTHNGSDVYELRKMHVHEAGPTLLGVNRETRLVSAKGMSDDDIDALAQRIASAIKGPPSSIQEEPAAHPAVKAHPARPSRYEDELQLLDLA